MLVGGRVFTYCGWTTSDQHHFETMVETITFAGTYRGIIRSQGFLGGAKRILSIHSIKNVAMGQNPVPPVNIPIPTKID